MELIKNKDILILKKGEVTIEEYKFNEEINFSNLMKHLLSLNLLAKIDLEDKIGKKTPEEENLLKLVSSIIEDYNSKVIELQKFKDEYEKE